jgi:hypothetical protein
MTITSGSWSFQLPDGTQVAYPIESLELVGDRATMVSVTGQKRVIMEFAGIRSAEMTQVRGKTSGDSNWVYYNRPLRRC